MNEEKLKGKGNEAIGAGKEKVGDWTDDPEMEQEGTEQKYKGKAQGAWGDAKEKVEDLKDKVTD